MVQVYRFRYTGIRAYGFTSLRVQGFSEGFRGIGFTGRRPPAAGPHIQPGRAAIGIFVVVAIVGPGWPSASMRVLTMLLTAHVRIVGITKAALHAPRIVVARILLRVLAVTTAVAITAAWASWAAGAARTAAGLAVSVPLRAAGGATLGGRCLATRDCGLHLHLCSGGRRVVGGEGRERGGGGEEGAGAGRGREGQRGKVTAQSLRVVFF